MIDNLRFEISFKNIYELENKLQFCLSNNIKNINIPCKGILKKEFFNQLLENFKDAGMNLLEDSVCKFIDEAVDKIKAEEQGHLLDLLKIWLISHEVKTVEVYYRIFKKIPFDKFMTHFRQVFKSHLLEMLDEKLTLDRIGRSAVTANLSQPVRDVTSVLFKLKTPN